MQKHIENYIKHFKLGEQSDIQCEICMREGRIDNGGFDIHHIIYRSHGGVDTIDNIMCLCRKCHDKIHNGKLALNEGDLRLIHNYFLSGVRKKFIK